MTQQEILDYNKRCAEFLGWKNLNDDSFPEYINVNCDFFQLKDLKFDSDWNWIHKILDRIKSITKFKNSYTNNTKRGSFNVIISKTCLSETTTVEISFDVDYDFRKMIFTESEGEKEAVIQAINQFLIWYNENNKQDA